MKCHSMDVIMMLTFKLILFMSVVTLLKQCVLYYNGQWAALDLLYSSLGIEGTDP